MWVDLGLDLEAHDALLGVLGKAYQDIYLSQPDRPEGMGYLDFVMNDRCTAGTGKFLEIMAGALGTALLAGG